MFYVYIVKLSAGKQPGMTLWSVLTTHRIVNCPYNQPSEKVKYLSNTFQACTIGFNEHTIYCESFTIHSLFHKDLSVRFIWTVASKDMFKHNCRELFEGKRGQNWITVTSVSNTWYTRTQKRIENNIGLERYVCVLLFNQHWEDQMSPQI